MSVPATERAGQASDDDAKKLAAPCGEEVAITLWEDRTRGELWIPSYDSSALVLTEDEFLRTANGNALEAGRRRFQFRVVTPGLHRVVFEKRLGWKFTAEDRRVFLIMGDEGIASGPAIPASPGGPRA